MLKKKRLMGLLLVGVLALMPIISAFAAIDESQESSKDTPASPLESKKRGYVRQLFSISAIIRNGRF